MKRLIRVRWSHLLSYSGVGALERADNDLFVVMDIGRWTDREGRPAGELLHYVDLLLATLEIDRKLRQPPLGRELQNGAVDGFCVPALRFPRWTCCPSCGLLHFNPWRREQEAESPATPPRCGCDRHSKLQQVAWVVVHPDGGLRDLPWHFLAHKDSATADACRQDWDRPYLHLLRDRVTGHWRLSCERCQASTRFDPKQPLDGSHPARQPWQHATATGSAIQSKQNALILEVNDSRVYLPRTRAALVIPPESRIQRGSVLDLLYCNRVDREALERCRSPLKRKGVLRRLADQYGCPAAEVETAWNEIVGGWPLYGRSVTPGELLAKEFQALSQPIPDLADSEDFVPRHQTDAWRALPPPSDG